MSDADDKKIEVGDIKIPELTTMDSKDSKDSKDSNGSVKRKRDDDDSKDAPEETENNLGEDCDQSKKVKLDDSDLSATESAEDDKPQQTTTTPAAGEPTATTTAVAAPVQTSTGNGQELLVIEVAPDKVGTIIGSKGLIIQEIQNRSGAKAFVNQDFPPGVNRQVNITGTPLQVKAASDLINMIITQGPTSIHENNVAGGASITQIIDCSQPQVGKIIGTGGATIKELQSKSGARIQIDQNFPPDVPRKISVTGSPAAVALGVQLIQNIMAGGNALMNMGMGATAAMGMYGGMGMGGMGMGGMGMGMGAGGQMQIMGNEAKQMVEVPKMFVGKIIGRGGENIGMIQRKSGARAMVDQAVPEGMPCKVSVSGTPQAVAACVQIIQEIMMGVPIERVGANLPAPGANPYGGYGGMGGGMPGMGGMQPQYGGYGGFGGQNPQMGGSMGQYGMANGGYPGYGAAGQTGMYPGMQPYGGGAAAAAVPPKPAVSSPWSEHKTDEGVAYWYNSATGVSQWERPKI
mmetsp:Transcript_37332/g.74336  ORF Transcript_37332/g.74336 Transcript_37332/m.74336 type:complete len:518 (+) Transcript_37332:54-1607(+)